MSAATTERNQTALSVEFDNKTQELHRRVETYISEEKRNIDQAQEQYLLELKELIKRRTAVETEIVRTTVELEKTYNKNKHLFQTIVDARIEESIELFNELKKI